MKKQLFILTLVLCMFFPSVVNAGTIPWGLLNKYTTAYEKNNEPEYIKAIEELVAYYADKPNNQEKLNIITPKLEILGLYYEKEGRIDEAIATFEAYIPFATEQGWDDGVRFVSDKLKVLNSSKIKLYVETTEPLNFGAKFEPNGILFGKPSDSYSSFTPTKSPSIVSVYTDLKNPNLLHYDKDVYSDVVLVNLNVPIPEKTNLNLAYQNDKLKSFAKSLSDLNKPVLLRIAGEMNVWSDRATAEEYISAYKNIVDNIRPNANNVAFVWSPNDLSGYDTNMFDYYPGDDYVDWLGVSSYTMLYFLGEKGHNEVTNTSFLAGDYANPIARLNYIRELNINKPIIITEGGIGHTYPKINESSSQWAAEKLDFLYTYLPIVAPEVKAIVHFDIKMTGEASYYDLYSNETMKKAYNEAISDSSYITNLSTTPSKYYTEYKNDTFVDNLTLYSYIAPIGVTKPTVKYYVSGYLVEETSDYGYKLELDYNDLFPGEHTLVIEVYDGDKLVDKTSTKINFERSAN